MLSIKKMGLTDDYFEMYNELSKKHGKVAYFIQKGKFFETYQYSIEDKKADFLSEDNSQIVGNAGEISNILEMTLTFQDKSKPVSRSNCRMLGFPVPSYAKHSETLKKYGFKVFASVEKKSKDGKITRVLEDKNSPVTSISESSEDINKNTIISIFIEIQSIESKYENYSIVCGLTVLDLAVGKSLISEAYSSEINCLQEIYRFLLSHPCKEVIVHVNNYPKVNSGYDKFLIDYLELGKIDNYLIKINDIPKEYHKSIYQKEFLEKLYGLPKETVLDELNLSLLVYGTISFIAIVQYCYEINPSIVNGLNRPETSWMDEEKYCILANNAIKQLDILPNSEKNTRSNIGNKIINSLFSVVNNTSTALGKRFLKKMLLTPIVEVDTLENYYNLTEELMKSYQKGGGLIVEIEKCLKEIHDLEKLQRKLVTKKILPHEFCLLYTGYGELINLTSLTLNSETDYIKDIVFLAFDEDSINKFNSLYSFLTNLYDYNILQSATLNKTTLITDGSLCKDDDVANDYFEKINYYKQELDSICEHLNSFLSSTRGALIKFEDDEGKLSLSTTNAKAKVLKQNLDQIDSDLCGDIEFQTLKNKTIITSKKILQYYNEYQILKEEYNKYLYEYYMLALDHIVEEYNIFSEVNKFLGLVDYIKSNAKTALKYHYERPIIEKTEDSWFQVEEIRHPIIERIITGKYITNDLTLRGKGLLLYGLNSGGKSSFVKSVALAIIMAQAGMFVAGRIKFSPYYKIITRLSGEDDPFKGKSSFVVEMSELRIILNEGDNKSGVFGDEPCHGTESNSALGIIAATLDCLVKRGTTFMFSTHYHDLLDVQLVKEFSDKIQVSHISAINDDVTDRLIYNRKLQPGPGENNYGVEVCKSLGFDKDFIVLAEKVRKTVINKQTEFLSTRKSKYNARVYLDKCSICGSDAKLQTHHIREQNEADEQNYIDYFHKNTPFNLTVLCDICHKKIHQD